MARTSSSFPERFSIDRIALYAGSPRLKWSFARVKTPWRRLCSPRLFAVPWLRVSWRVRISFYQTHPRNRRCRSANATAPASNVGAPDVGSRDTVAVKPAVEADLPLTCIANGATREAARSICDLPMPGSPTTRQCEVPRAKVSFPAAPWFLCWCCSRAFNELLRRF